MKKCWKKIPKWGKIILWILGIVAGLILVAFIGFKIWVSTWKTYRNDDFGFSFSYPSNWYISGNDITLKQLLEKNAVLFWVDSKKILPVNGQESIRSPGNVEVWIYKEPTSILEGIKRQWDNFSLFKSVKYGRLYGYTYEDIHSPLTITPYDNRQIAAEYVYLDSSDYFYLINTVTYSNDTSFLSKIISRYYHWIGTKIIKSFVFVK